MIGSFGDIIFETTDKRILTFSEFRRSASSRYSDHEVIGQKPISEYNGPGLDGVTFVVKVKRSLGVDTDKILNLLMKYSREGHAYPLVIGPKTIGVDKWKIVTLDMGTERFGRNASYDSVSVELSLNEYVEKLK